MTDPRDALFAEALSALALAGDSDTAAQLQRRWDAVERQRRNEAVSWLWEEQTFGIWKGRIGDEEPEAGPRVRNVRPLYARPTTADEALEQAAQEIEGLAYLFSQASVFARVVRSLKGRPKP